MKRVFSFIVTFLFVFSCFADSSKVKEIVKAQYCDELLKNGVVKMFHDDNNMELLLLPSTIYKTKINNGRIKKDSKPFLFESLFLIKKDDLLKNSNSSKQNITISDVSKVMRSISTMQGITYYSNSKKKYRVLYKSAYTIANESSKKAVADNISGNADGKVLFCLLDDASFGQTRYRLNYYQSENELYTTFTTIDNLGLGLISGVDAGELRINILVIDCDDSFLLYLAPDANCIDFPGIDKKVKDSLIARMDSIYNWFIKQF